jgi:nitronate monooxygenase
MPLHTPLTDLFGLQHPIILAPMAGVSGGALAAAVASAGGLGLIGGGYGDEAWGGEDWLNREYAIATETSGGERLGVGFITWSLAKKPKLLDVALAHKPTAIMLSFGDPASFSEQIHKAGALLICQVQTLAAARAAVAAGADVIVAQGTEAGGHGASRGTMALVPAVVDAAAPVPVVAAGGIADGRGLAAALALGAAGALVGTRFFAAAEAGGHPNAGERIVAAGGDHTRRTSVVDIIRGKDWPQPYTGRVLVNDFVDRWHGKEAVLTGNLADESARYAEAAATGNFDEAAIHAGEAVDLIHDVLPAGKILSGMTAEAEQILRNLASLPK